MWILHRLVRTIPSTKQPNSLSVNGLDVVKKLEEHMKKGPAIPRRNRPRNQFWDMKDGMMGVVFGGGDIIWLMMREKLKVKFQKRLSYHDVKVIVH